MRGWIRPSGRGLRKCRNKTRNKIVPRGVETPGVPDGTWVGMGIEAFNALYPRGRDGI
jgi:hypothetical protein